MILISVVRLRTLLDLICLRVLVLEWIFLGLVVKSRIFDIPGIVQYRGNFSRILYTPRKKTVSFARWALPVPRSS